VTAPRPRAQFDPLRLRADFPILGRRVHGKPLVYLDNAATTHKPRPVIDAVARHYERDNANVHRSAHALGERATGAYERARRAVRDFLGAADEREVVFTRGTTESINLVAASWGAGLGAGDEVVVTAMEHHANIVPWQLACRARGAALRVAPVTDRGELDLAALGRLLGPRTRIVALAHVSNALGTVNPVAEVAALAHRHGAVVLVDGALATAHLPIDVRALDCDFYAFSGHKVFAPTGIGVLWGRGALLDAMPPWQGGGEMILSVSFEDATYDAPPYRFEAGTPPIAGAIGLGAALDWLAALDADARAAHEADLLAYAEDALRAVPGLRLVGTAARKVGVHSFVLDGVHPHDVGTILDHHGVAIRAGHHCAQPLMARLGVPATARASFALYNTRADVDRLIDGLRAVRTVLRRCPS
jgi:cysteine desulfurase/selenocysteine lyase